MGVAGVTGDNTSTGVDGADGVSFDADTQESKTRSTMPLRTVT